MTLKLGLQTGYWGAGPPASAAEQIRIAEELEFESFWTAEAYGSDALTPLAWWGAATSRIKLGTAVIQMSARTPSATAMAALTLDHLSGGRVLLGIGASGPQVVEGWYGQDYTRPLQRTREYVHIMRDVWKREQPLEFTGAQYQLPFAGGTGLGKPLKSTVHPLRSDIPIYLGAEGPKNVALAAEICDGWLPLFFSPRHERFYTDALAEGFARPGARRNKDTFDVAAGVSVVIDPDVEAAADKVRPSLALYMGGMGARRQSSEGAERSRSFNFHFEVFARMGYEDVAVKVQDLYLAGKKSEAAAAIPTVLVEDVALIGPVDKIREELVAWEDSCISTLLLSGPPELLRTMAELVRS